MQNIDKTDINSPGSTSQQEHRQERALKAVRNRRQVRLSAETKEQRQANLETERDNSIVWGANCKNIIYALLSFFSCYLTSNIRFSLQYVNNALKGFCDLQIARCLTQHL